MQTLLTQFLYAYICVLTGVFAAVALALHIRYIQNGWRTEIHLLKPLMILGCIGQLASIVAFAVYLTIAIVEKQSRYSIV